ncbi:hypothetical protein L1987_81600 [Smallanthus sonchifolius]|uniref:Uncharacterized protein n=1 Tax=Smallanthus sonchifolius TaxID=185202 RepID=A0ACB8YRJ6_9ASTR|nr:hypothetical protein L1987_81600 [Smallanthus sonchifolius]
MKSVWSLKSLWKVVVLWGGVLFLYEDLDDCLSLRKVCIRTNEKNVIRENVSVNVEEKKYQVRVNEFASWVPTFNNIEKYESNDEESSNNGGGNSIEKLKETNVNLEDVTVAVNDSNLNFNSEN